MGISYYFMNKANKQVGPLSLDELKQKGITRETPVWREGMPNWVQAKDIPELHAYIVTPSPYINVVRLILILYAILGSIVFLFAGKFVSAFIASCFNLYPYVPGFVTLIIGILGIAFFLFYKKRKYLLNTILVVLPFLLSSLFSIYYYGILNHAYRFRQDRCVMEKRSGVGVMNKFGLTIVPYIYNNIAPNSYWAPAYYWASCNHQKGVLALDGTEIIPCIYDDVDTWLSTDNFIVTSGNLNGLYSPEGIEILPCEYTGISLWRKTSLVLVEIEDREGLYTQDGEEILPCQFIICDEFNGISLINCNGFVKDGKVRDGIWGVINQEGKIIVPCKYNDITSNVDTESIEADGGYIKDIYDFNGNYLRSEYKW